MSATVIRDFLVALGFDTDNAGAKKMGDTLQGVENKAKSLNLVLMGLATGAVIAVTKTANELDKLYYASQRIGASASNIRGFESAIAQMGGSAGNALQTLESLAQKMRQSPGYEGMIGGIGVATRDQNGVMRDRVEVMKDMAKQFQGMEYYQANARASALGIDEGTLMAMRDPSFMQNMEKYQRLQKEMGMSDDLTKSGKDFMVEFRDITMTTKAITEVIVMTAGKALIPVLKLINTGLQSAIHWFDELNPGIKSFLATGLKIATLVLVFGGLFGAIKKLAMVLPILKGLLFLIRGISAAFLMSPIGIVLALAAAIGLLWDDYQTWKNGGKSLIDWSAWAGGIETAISKIKELAEMLLNLRQKAIDLLAVAMEKVAPVVAPVVEPAVNAVKKVTEANKTAAQLVVAAAKHVVNRVTGSTKEVGKALGGGQPGGMKNGALNLSKQDIDDIVKVTSTEVVGGLKGKDFEQQTKGVVDTILNRTVSGKWGGTVRDVVNAHRQFTKITGPESYKTKSGKVIKNNPYGKVQNMPDKDVNPKVRELVLKYLNERANGAESIVGTHLNYANPYASDMKNRKAWVDEFYEKSKSEGLVFGSGKAVHGHGTTKDLEKYRPKSFAVVIDGKGSGVNANLNIPTINSVAPPNTPLLPKGYSANGQGANKVVNLNTTNTTTINLPSGTPQSVANQYGKEMDSKNIQIAKNAQGYVN